MKTVKLNSQERILLAARDLLWEHGLKGTTTTRIAQKAEVNAVTIFRIFKSKENLMWKIITSVSETELAKLHEVLKKDFNSLEVFFGELNETFIQLALPMHKTFSAVMKEDDDPENVFCSYVEDLTLTIINSIAAKLAALHQQGILKKLDFAELALLHFNYCLGSSLQVSKRNETFTGKTIAQSVESMTNILINGLRPE